MEQLTDGAMTERLERTSEWFLEAWSRNLLHRRGARSEFGALSLCRDGKIRKSGGRGHYVLAEDVAVEEQPDEVVPVRPKKKKKKKSSRSPSTPSRGGWRQDVGFGKNGRRHGGRRHAVRLAVPGAAERFRSR